MIYFENISKIYPKNIVALADINLEISPKEFICLVGPSGAGKTTILKLLIAEEKPTTGKIFFDNLDIVTLKPKELPYLRRKIGLVFQDFKLLSHKTVYENVSFAMEAVGFSDKQIKEDVSRILKLVGLSDKILSFPVELSGGEKQRVAIARAIAHRPKILLADEPTGNLDPLNTFEIIKLLLKINEFGTTVILATHDREVIKTIGKQRIISLDEGRIIKDDKNGSYIL